jgi:predicted ATPase/DNA-binding SARP family transcriptional activator
MSSLALYVLGSPRVELDGAPVAIDRRKALALLVYLALTRQDHSRDALATLLWPESDQSKARASLRSALWSLTKALGEGWLDVDRETVRLKSGTDAWLDVDAFQDRLAECRTHDHPSDQVCPDCLSALAEAAALYQDDFMVGFTLPDSPGFDEWQFFQAEGLRQDLVSVLARLARGHGERGEYEEAITQARRWVALDPLYEPAQRLLMRLYAWSGQRSAALRQYEECARVLQEELGVLSDEETTRLYTAIKEKAELPPPTERPAPPAVAGAARPKHNLPVQLTPFVGREAALAEIADLLQDPACRLLTLVGPGGSGKTRLALEAVAGQLDNYSYGVFFVSLAPLDAADLIVPAVAQALGFTFDRGVEPRQQLLDYLSQKRLLLILDGFEHLLGPPPLPPPSVPPSGAVRPAERSGDGRERGGADLVTDMLKAAPALRILVTSRAVLNLQGEHLFSVPGMDLPDQESAEDVLAYSAVKLFLQGARRAQPGFEPTGDVLRDVVWVCRQVQGMPLGILLAAAWVGMLSPAEIAVEIGRSLDFLETDLRDVPQRQRSMRAVFDHSWSLLTERQREMLQGLSVFRGGFNRQAAQRVTGVSLSELKGLVDRSLVQRAPTGRYDVHELLRQYATEKLELSAAASEKVGDRHCAHYTAALEQWGNNLKGVRRLAALAEMNLEIENARRAWNWAAERGQVQRLERAVLGLCQFYHLRGRYQECEADCAAAARRLEGMMSGTSGDAPVLSKAKGLRVLARVLEWQGGAAFELGRIEAGQQLVQQSLALLDDPALAGQDTRAQRASIVEWMDHMAFYTAGKGVRPRTQSLEARLALYQELGDRWKMAEVLHSLGNRAFWWGDLDQAKKWSEEKLVLCQELGDQLGIAGAYWNLGNVARERGELDKAEHLYRKVIKIPREVRNPSSLRWARQFLGETLMLAGRFAQARRLLEETLATLGHLGDTAVAGLCDTLAMVEMHDGDYERARARGDKSLALSRNAHYDWGVAHSLHDLSCVAVAEAESGLGAGTAPQMRNVGEAREAYAEAQRLAQESATICREMHVRIWLGYPLVILGYAARGLGDVDQAGQHLHEALRVAGESGSFWPLMLAVPAAALLLADAGEHERAVDLYALASRYPLVANSRWFHDVASKHIAAVAATLPPDVVTAARERGRARDLDATVAELLVELEPDRAS